MTIDNHRRPARPGWWSPACKQLGASHARQHPDLRGQARQISCSRFVGGSAIRPDVLTHRNDGQGRRLIRG